MTLTQILVAAQEQRKASIEAHSNRDYHAEVQHGVAYWALRSRADKLKIPPDVTPAGTPMGARQVAFEKTDVVTTRKAA